MTIPVYRLVEVGLFSMLNLMPFLLLGIYYFRRHLRFTHHVTNLLVAGMALLQMGLGHLIAFGPVSAEILSLLSTVIYAGFFFLIVRDRIGRQAFVLLVLANLGNLVSICAKCLEGYLFGDLALETYRWSLSVCMVIMHLAITLPIVLYIRKYFTSDIPIEAKHWRFLWIIPAAFYAIWYYHLYFAGHSDLEVAMDVKHAVYLLIINVGALAVYHMANQMLLAQKENATLTQNNYLLTLQNIQYENLQQRVDEARQARHDVRHHAHMVLEYLHSGKLQELEAYLEQYADTLPNAQPMLYCAHYETNTLLSYFVQLAEQHGITVDTKVQFPQTISLPETTLAVLLGNLLENAVDACKEITDGQRKITVRGKVSDGFVFFDIANTFNGNLNVSRNGHYHTTKENGEGLGLRSVAHMVKLHNGAIEVNTDDNVFSVSIMLKENKA